MTDLDLAGKRVLIREDLNVPVKDGVVTSDKRIRAALPSIEYAMKQGAKVMVMSHLGRPTEGEYSKENSLKPVARVLEKLLSLVCCSRAPKPSRTPANCRPSCLIRPAR